MDNRAFISYRRDVSAFMARAVFQDLRSNGIDVFMDVESIDAGQFDTIILHQIAARPYFLVILTPGSLKRCKNPPDWLLREITHAVALQRIIIPLVSPNFSFAEAERFLPGNVATERQRANAVKIPHDYFQEAMDRLRTRFLKPVDLPTQVINDEERMVVERKTQRLTAAPVTQQQLSAQNHIERALIRGDEDLEGKIAEYTEALRKDPNSVTAYEQRGDTYARKGNFTKAMADYREVIKIAEQGAESYWSWAFYTVEARDGPEAAAVYYEEAERLRENAARISVKAAQLVTTG
jgi:tetratricopeptide (TPR) repeat protein